MASTLAVVSLVNLGWLSGSLLLTWFFFDLLLLWRFLVVNLAAVHHGGFRAANRGTGAKQCGKMRQGAKGMWWSWYGTICFWKDMNYIITTHSAKHMCVISCDQQFHQLIPPASSNSYVYTILYNMSTYIKLQPFLLWHAMTSKCSKMLHVTLSGLTVDCG